ncbi:MAG TPA: hypothetical protein VK681_05035 [Reyranella sp.]|jgi:Putative AphA-like transcriptional regulator|nr:hypothetical protein [Reyranella sp.]
METDRQDLLPKDAVSVGVLTVTAMNPLATEGILRALVHIGAPSWRPVGDVVVGAIDGLRDIGLLAVAAPGDRGGARLAPTARGRAVLPDLLYVLPLSGTSPDIGYKLKVMGLDVLEAAARERQLRALLDHWRDVATMWQDAEHRCPCRQPSVRGWMQHNIDLARSEIEWLTAARS